MNAEKAMRENEKLQYEEPLRRFQIPLCKMKKSPEQLEYEAFLVSRPMLDTSLKRKVEHA